MTTTKRKYRAVKKFTISLKKWLRGGGAGVGRLYNAQTKRQCCLGIYLTACGIPEEEQSNEFMPTGLLRLWSDMPDWLTDTSEEAPVFNLADTNDAKGTLLAKRKAKIRAGFKKQGIAVRFVA